MQKENFRKAIRYGVLGAMGAIMGSYVYYSFKEARGKTKKRGLQNEIIK